MTSSDIYWERIVVLVVVNTGGAADQFSEPISFKESEYHDGIGCSLVGAVSIRDTVYLVKIVALRVIYFCVC